MSLPEVTPEQILNAMQHVPTARWGEALRAIQSLQNATDAAAPECSLVRTGSDLRDSALIGIWADRTDIRNSKEFARDLRRQAEQRK